MMRQWNMSTWMSVKF